MKKFKGKAIYQPSGKAGEYAAWACNFYVGCSNGCEYCYCKKGFLAGTMGQDKPQLKKCFKDGADALRKFAHEVYMNREELRKNGLFFSFTTDPLLPETYGLTWNAMSICSTHKVPVKVLTKRADSALKFLMHIPTSQRNNVAVGFTLTGHDELEPSASTNLERIEAMRKLHEAGFKTFASIEPIIEIHSSITMIEATINICDHYKIGLLKGKEFGKKDLNSFIHATNEELSRTTIYWKDSILKGAGIPRESLPSNCVTRDFNLFTNK